MADTITIEECITRLDAIRHEIVSNSRDHFALSAGIAALYEMESGHAVNRWIPCSERLPEFNEPVLTFDGQCIIVEQRIEYILDDDEEPIYGGWWIDGVEGDEENLIGLRDGAATHWMPLPEPPESEVQDDD